jgi:Holliday junction resolvase-like predicted endonuclease
MNEGLLVADFSVYSVILDFLIEKIIKEYDKRFEGESLEEELLSSRFLGKIVGKVYSKELKRVKSAVSEVLNSLVRVTRDYQQRVMYDVKWVTTILGRLDYGEHAPVKKDVGRWRSSLYIQTISYLRDFRLKVFSVLARRSFAYAMYLAILLDKRVVNEGVEIFVGEPLIHRVWSSLAEDSVGLLRERDVMCGGIDGIVGVLEKSCKELLRENSKEVIEDLEHELRRGGRDYESKVSEILAKYVKPVTESQELYKQVIDYYLDHLRTLGTLPEISAKDLRNYLKKVFCERSFLEYEVYSYLVNSGVPAFPRLQLRTTDLDYGEVDVLATLGDGLHVIEVTTRKSEKGLEDKLVKLQQIRTALNADEILLITTKENLEELEKTDHCSDIKCIALEKLPTHLQKLTKKTT